MADDDEEAFKGQREREREEKFKLISRKALEERIIIFLI